MIYLESGMSLVYFTFSNNIFCWSPTSRIGNGER